MNDPNRPCTCEGGGRIETSVTLLCGICGGRLLPHEKTEELENLTRQGTKGIPSRLAGGLYRFAKGFGESDFVPGRREVVVAIVSGIFGAVAAPVVWRLGLNYVEDDEDIRNRRRSSHLELGDVSAAEAALQALSASGDRNDFESKVSAYRVSGKHAVADLLIALAGHAIGVSPRKSELTFNDLISGDHDPEVRRYLLERRAKVRGLIGESNKGLDDLGAALKLTPEDGKSRLKLLRQIMNHAYVSIPFDDVLKPDRWSGVQENLRHALGILELHPDSSDWSDPSRIDRAIIYDGFLGPGVLIFEALTRAAEAIDSPDECRRALQWHLDLITELVKAEPITGWNRYTPLAAQAIALDHLDFAQKVLSVARSDAIENRNKYAQLQYQNQGAEWLLHQIVQACLHLTVSEKLPSRSRRKVEEREKALAALEAPLDRQNYTKTATFLRQALLYKRLALGNDQREQKRDAYVGGFLTTAWTHWTYLPFNFDEYRHSGDPVLV